MTHTAIPPGATIRARVHESALKRVTRFFASTLYDIFTETLQNSRRAGATRVRVTVATPGDQPAAGAPEPSETLLTVTVTDDGAGIEDPGGPAELRRERLERRTGGPARTPRAWES